MGITKPTFYIFVILIVVVIGLGLMNFGIVMSVRRTLSNASNTYIESYAAYALSSGIVSFSDAQNVDLEQKKLLSADNDTGQSTIEEALASTNYYASRTQPTINYFKLTFNLPTFFVLSFGLDVQEFSILINTLGLVLFISLLIMIFKIVRGS